MLKFCTREQCEQFQMMRFDVSCSTCERSDEECPWHRQDDLETSVRAEMKQLEDENRKLTHVVAELTLDNRALKNVGGAA